MRASLVGLATLASLALGSGEVHAQFAANQAGKCVLGTGALSALEQSLKNDAGLTGKLSVDAIVIHSVANPNEGQPIGANNFTGPIVCTFKGPKSNYVIADAPQDANTRIPASGKIDILGTEITTAIQYRAPSAIQSPPNGGTIKKLMCLTTDSSNNCFIIAPPGQAVP
jgi:hypothetical protein